MGYMVKWDHVKYIGSCLNVPRNQLKRLRRTKSKPTSGKGPQQAADRQLQAQATTHGWRKYWKRLRLLPISLGLSSLGVVLLVALQQFRRRNKDPADCPDLIAKDWEVKCYRMVPLRALSRAWGWIHTVDLPIWARRPFLSWYCELFGCNLNEAEVGDLRHYRNLGEFFRRGLKDGTRPIAPTKCVASPADGTVLHFGKVECGYLEQVKGVTYSISQFLGPQTWTGTPSDPQKSLVEYQRSLLTKPENQLYHCVIYLAPGDYHRFHSPVNWTVHFRRHFPGELLSVSPIVAKWLAGLFCLNERAAYIGEWEYGFFSMIPVGATNVGSIRVGFDLELETNKKKKSHNQYYDIDFPGGVELEKGAPFGEFNLGSTVVLIFEAPKDFQFKIEPGLRIKFGEGLNYCLDGSEVKICG